MNMDFSKDLEVRLHNAASKSRSSEVSVVSGFGTFKCRVNVGCGTCGLSEGVTKSRSTSALRKKNPSVAVGLRSHTSYVFLFLNPSCLAITLVCLL